MIYECSLKVDQHSYTQEDKTILTKVEELYRAIVDANTEEIIIQDDFARRYFSEVETFVQEVKRLNPKLSIRASSPPKVSMKDKINELCQLSSKDEIIDFLSHNSQMAVELIHHLCYENSSVNREATVFNRLSNMHMEISKARGLLVKEKIKSNNGKYLLDETMKQLDQVISDEDEHQDVILKVTQSTYKKILYIKEMTRVRFVDTFLYFLKEMIETRWGVPVPLLVLEGPYAYHKHYLYPDVDVFMAGLDTQLIKPILLNNMEVPYLIVLDRSGYKQPCLKGAAVEYFYTVSDIKDLNRTLPLNRIISYKKSTLHIPYVENYTRLKSVEQFFHYASMDIMKSLLSLLDTDDDR